MLFLSSVHISNWTHFKCSVATSGYHIGLWISSLIHPFLYCFLSSHSIPPTNIYWAPGYVTCRGFSLKVAWDNLFFIATNKPTKTYLNNWDLDGLVIVDSQLFLKSWNYIIYNLRFLGALICSTCRTSGERERTHMQGEAEITRENASLPALNTVVFIVSWLAHSLGIQFLDSMSQCLFLPSTLPFRYNFFKYT